MPDDEPPEPHEHKLHEDLLELSRTDPESLSTLFPLLYQSLHELARKEMAKEAAGHTLQPTALVNEVYLRLTKSGQSTWPSRRYFFSAAAQCMRRILVDHAPGTAASSAAARRGRSPRISAT